MTIDDYAEWAATVAKVTADPGSEKFSYLGLGLSAESGEVADLIKKLLRDGTLDRAALIEELGDVIYYWCCLCVASETVRAACQESGEDYREVIRGR
jgi:NTP pyrophosphatase (non-canonical NTP hydrolase)